MPCNMGMGKYNPKDDEIQHLKNKVVNLEAGLCAIITELEREGIAETVIGKASENGRIDLAEFWIKHKENDRVRLTAELFKFSDHERSVFFDLLNETARILK